MANGTLEVEVAESDDSNARRKLRKASIPLYRIQQLLREVNNKDPKIADNHLASLLASNVLILGMEVPCSHCEHKTWFDLDNLSSNLKCERCLRQFNFPLTTPHRNVWSYRVQGPFAVEDFANGAYSVATAIHLLANNISRECTWIPSFKLRAANASEPKAEADFAVFLRPVGFSHLTDPMLIFGECKTFGDFDSRDCKRMTSLAKLFPGAIICFCTLKSALTGSEKRKIAQLTRLGRRSLKTGQQQNPVLVLTRAELIGQFKLGGFYGDYPPQFVKQAEGVFMSDDLQEICSFTQQVHLGIESYHEWLDVQHRKRQAKRATVS